MVGAKTSRDIVQDLKESALWGEIQRAAKDDPILKELLDQVYTYFLMKYR